MKGKTLSAALALAVVLAAILPAASNAQTANPLVIWVAPDGDDANDGATRDTPVATLTRVNLMLCPSVDCAGLDRPVEIRIEPGVYMQEKVVWRYFDDNHPTRFMPADYQLGDGWTQVSAAGGRPGFDGDTKATQAIYFVQQRPSTTGRTNLEFYYLEWRRYIWQPLDIRGQAGVGRAEGNLFVGNYFHRVGNNWDPSLPMAYGGVWLGGSDRNTIRANHFVEILNEPAVGRGHEHGLYLVNSRSNMITGNRFYIIGGDPVRVRNKASGNQIVGNRFEKAGGLAYAGDWYCTASHVAAGACGPVEYRSWSNVLRDNTFISMYPRGLTGRAAAYCYDLRTRCPAGRIAVF